MSSGRYIRSAILTSTVMTNTIRSINTEAFMSKKRSSAGGSAMQAGADYQNRVAAWLATKI